MRKWWVVLVIIMMVRTKGCQVPVKVLKTALFRFRTDEIALELLAAGFAAAHVRHALIAPCP